MYLQCSLTRYSLMAKSLDWRSLGKQSSFDLLIMKHLSKVLGVIHSLASEPCSVHFQIKTVMSQSELLLVYGLINPLSCVEFLCAILF